MPQPARPRLLLVTDLSYPARGRRYGDEDTWLAARLREEFDLALCHPLDARALAAPSTWSWSATAGRSCPTRRRGTPSAPTPSPPACASTTR
ncbi:hypothetical protein ACFQVA_10080 [Actinomadura keratinilytica]